MKVFLVTMYRWGDKDGHSYVEGVYTDRSVAQEQGLKERTRRDSKYEPDIKEMIVNEDLVCRRDRELSLVKVKPKTVPSALKKTHSIVKRKKFKV